MPNTSRVKVTSETEQIQITLPIDLLARIRNDAKKKNLSVSAYLRMFITESYEKVDSE